MVRFGLVHHQQYHQEQNAGRVWLRTSNLLLPPSTLHPELDLQPNLTATQKGQQRVVWVGLPGVEMGPQGLAGRGLVGADAGNHSWENLQEVCPQQATLRQGFSAALTGVE